LGAALLAAGAAAGGRVPMPALTVDKSTQCVAPPEVMRREHMRMLARQKVRTVQFGIRGEPVHLAGCIECHASKTTGSVVGSPDAFCESCHAYVGVRLDCFDCHQPTVKRSTAAGRPQ
jgi:hypothetical protein